MRNCEIIIKTQEYPEWILFDFPVRVSGEDGHWWLNIGGELVGTYSKREYAEKVAKYVLRERVYYLYEQNKYRSVTIAIPEEELVANTDVAAKIEETE